MGASLKKQAQLENSTSGPGTTNIYVYLLSSRQIGLSTSGLDILLGNICVIKSIIDICFCDIFS